MSLLVLYFAMSRPVNALHLLLLVSEVCVCVVDRETDEITSVLFCCESLFLYAHWKVCFWMHIDTSAKGKNVSVVKKGWVTRHELMHMCTRAHTHLVTWRKY